jgi:hypothetical protein
MWSQLSTQIWSYRFLGKGSNNIPFPTTVVARSYFSALLHEATCERMFSYTGRLLTKQRVQLDPD